MKILSITAFTILTACTLSQNCFAQTKPIPTSLIPENDWVVLRNLSPHVRLFIVPAYKNCEQTTSVQEDEACPPMGPWRLDPRGGSCNKVGWGPLGMLNGFSYSFNCVYIQDGKSSPSWGQKNLKLI